MWEVGENQSIYQSLINEYEKQNPNITINYVEVPSTYYASTLYSKIKSGKEVPDIVSIPNSFVPYFSSILYNAAAQDVKPDEVEKYGVIKFGPDNKTVETIVEKPKKEEAPSNTITFGRFILNNEVLEEIAKRQLGKDNELWLSDAIANLAKQGKVVAVKIQGRWMTTGDPLNFLKTTIEYAKDREDLWRELKIYIENSIKES